MDINLAEGMDIDAQTVMTGRGCAIGQSGSGKSFLAGVVAEELCRNNMPFCVLDTEGEYSSLKLVSQSVLVVGGDRGDVGLDVDFERLFSTSIKNDLQVILDLSEEMDKNAVAQKALTALYEMDSRVRKPYLVIIEEADKFAPQVVKGKDINVVEEISVRGRKRGIGLFITTQRPANISKNVLAQCSYGFVGRLTIENDLNALRMLFNNNEKLASITKLTTGQFLPFGLEHESIFKVKAREAAHIGSTPKVGQYMPMNSRMESILRELKGVKQVVSDIKKKTVAGDKISIRALRAGITIDDAKAYAERIAKRKFIVFGYATEKMDSIDLVYMPMGWCTVRFPAKPGLLRRQSNEYTEYFCLISTRNELIKLDRGISVLKEENRYREERSNYKNYLLKEQINLEKVDAAKRDLLSQMNERKAKDHLVRFFPDALVVDFSVVYAPVYRITLRDGNRIRVFNMDGIWGKEMEL